jgi:uncharacterized membrane protein YphA (DoxX/SURF4 family)
MILLKSLVTIFLLLLGFECMVYAFHLLNRPSDTAVYEGMACLAILFIFLPLAIWRFWRWSL